MNLYERVLAEVKPYLGKRAESVLESQCKTHLKISPQDLSLEHIDQLVKWVKITTSLMIPSDQVDALVSKIIALKNE